MPESVRDRPTKAHEYLFLLSKSERYYYNADAIAEEATFPDGPNSPESITSPYGQGFTRRAKSGNTERKMGAERGRPGSHLGGSSPWEGSTRNARSVWTIATRPYAGAHFATMPPDLAERCILAGSAPGDTVLDPFGGSGTTAATATGHGRAAIHIDLSPDYIELARQRVGPMMCGAVG
jgi:DNA modification methylase